MAGAHQGDVAGRKTESGSGAIYELDGDTLKVCGGGVGDPLPKEFKADAGVCIAC